MKILLAYIIFFTSLTAACSDDTTAQKGTSKNELVTTAPKSEDKQDRELKEQLEQIAAAAKGKVGAAAVILETGESVSLRPHERFPMQSVYKLPISMAVLKKADAGEIKLEQKIRVEKSDFVRPGQHSPISDKHPNGAELSISELIRLAISESDGTASDILLGLAGGSEAMGKYLEELGVSGMAVVNTEKEFAQNWQTQYDNWATPEGAVSLLRALHEGRGLSAYNRELLLKFMTESVPGKRRLKGLLPAGTAVAHKTGTSGSREGVTAATNDIGIVTLPNGKHLAIAVFVADSPADEKTREEVIEKIARAVWDKWADN